MKITGNIIHREVVQDVEGKIQDNLFIVSSNNEVAVHINEDIIKKVGGLKNDEKDGL